jgi:hypothetical protein
MEKNYTKFNEISILNFVYNKNDSVIMPLQTDFLVTLIQSLAEQMFLKSYLYLVYRIKKLIFLSVWKIVICRNRGETNRARFNYVQTTYIISLLLGQHEVFFFF